MMGTIVFRADASPLIGSGHIIRSLALAAELSKAGHSIVFVARELPESLRRLIIEAGHALRMLPTVSSGMKRNEGMGTCAHWLQAPWKVDAEQTLENIRDLGEIEWLIIDHYALDIHWEKELRPLVKYILVLDDLADRKHDCDILVDEMVVRKPDEYKDLVPSHCRVLTGARYTILREEFSRLRMSSIERRLKEKRVRRLLVILGSGSPENLLIEAVSAIADNLSEDMIVDIALGAMQISNAGKSRIKAILGKRGVFHDFSASVARLMHDADIAVGASGMAAYERCCMGLPSIQFVQAENQIVTAEYFHRAGAALTIDANSPSFFQDLKRAVRGLMENKHLRRKMVVQAADIVDGLGTRRIREAMEGL